MIDVRPAVPAVDAPANVGAIPAPASLPPQPLVVRVHEVLVEHLHIAVPTPDTDIVDSGALDSFALVELLVTIEEQFGVEVVIDELEVEHFRSARSIATLISGQAP